jgi:uroporphyrin-3 C-methyltransferase
VAKKTTGTGDQRVSDQSDTKDTTDPVKKEGEASAWNPAIEPPPKPAPALDAKLESRRGSSAVAWLALLLIVALCGAAAFSVLEAQRREGALLGRLVDLESVENNQQSELAELEQRMEQKLRTGLVKAKSGEAGTTARLERIDSSLERMDAALVIQREEIARFGATDRKDWLLAEAEYLLRLANQRLIMSGDIVAAIALLRSADNILLELEDATLHDTRAALAADLAALRAIPRVDVEGLYLRLAGLIEQVDQLAIFQLPDAAAMVEAVPAEDWQQRLQQGYKAALHKLSDYIVIRRRDVPYEALMDPQWEGLVRQNLRMLLEQAQVALLSGNQLLFRQSLERAGHWVGQFFEVDEAGSKALAEEIAALLNQTIEVDIGDVTNSLRQLDDAMARRLQLEGGD